MYLNAVIRRIFSGLQGVRLAVTGMSSLINSLMRLNYHLCGKKQRDRGSNVALRAIQTRRTRYSISKP